MLSQWMSPTCGLILLIQILHVVTVLNGHRDTVLNGQINYYPVSGVSPRASMQKHKIARFSFCVLNVDHDVECTDIHPAVFKNVEEVSMSEQSMKTNPSSSQNAPQQVDPSLETLLQVLSNVDSEIVLHEAATAKEATIDALLTRFEDITSILRQAKRRRQLKRKDYGTSLTLTEQQSLDCDSKTLGNRARMPTEILRQLTQSGFLSTVDLAKTLLLTCKCCGTARKNAKHRNSETSKRRNVETAKHQLVKEHGDNGNCHAIRITQFFLQ
jgi:hypothetical protein